MLCIESAHVGRKRPEASSLTDARRLAGRARDYSTVTDALSPQLWQSLRTFAFTETEIEQCNG
jgi:hypothetical protein